jgi:hypothetical protein
MHASMVDADRTSSYDLVWIVDKDAIYICVCVCGWRKGWLYVLYSIQISRVIDHGLPFCIPYPSRAYGRQDAPEMRSIDDVVLAHKRQRKYERQTSI